MAGDGGFWIQAIPVVAVSLVFWSVIIRPARVRDYQRYLTVKDIKGGEKVVLTGGLVGTAAGRDGDEYLVDLSEGFRVRVLQDGIREVRPPVIESADSLPV